LSSGKILEMPEKHLFIADILQQLLINATEEKISLLV